MTKVGDSKTGLVRLNVHFWIVHLMAMNQMIVVYRCCVGVYT